MVNPKLKEVLEKRNLQVEMIKHLLKYRFSWDEIQKAFGFSEEQLKEIEDEVNHSHE